LSKTVDPTVCHCKLACNTFEIKYKGDKNDKPDYVLFKIEVEFAAEKWHIFRKYKQYQEIDAVFRRGIPGFPGVLPMSGKKFDKDFLEERKRALDLYLKVLCEGRPHVFQKKNYVH